MLAYNVLFSLLPVLAAISVTIGVLVQNESLRNEISLIVSDELPVAVSDPVIDTSEVTNDNREGFGLIALVTLLYGGSRMYGALDRAFAVVYRSRRRGYLERKLVALLVAPVLSVALVVSTAVSATATGLLTTSLNKYLELNGNIEEYLSAYFISFMLAFVVSLIAYAKIPVDGSGWRGSIPGAAATGGLFVMLSQLYPLYVSITGGYNAYGTAFGLVLVFMFWLYLVAQIIIIGAEICAVSSGVRASNEWRASRLSKAIC